MSHISVTDPWKLAEEMAELKRENAALRERVDAWKEEAIEHGAKLHTLEHENAALRKQAVEVLMIGRAWSEVCFDHLSPASVEQFIALEKQILKQGKEAQP